MIKFILNNQSIETDLPKGTTVLDFVRYRKNLKGTKIGCREGDCGACTLIVGELRNESVKYRTQTSCLMPLANAAGKHIVTIEGINKQNGGLTEVQSAMVENNGTQCGFCTVGFVMSLTNFCIDDSAKTLAAAISAIDGNICRCTGYKSIERACAAVSGEREIVSGEQLAEFSEPLAVSGEQFKSNLEISIEKEIVPAYFSGIKERLLKLKRSNRPQTADDQPLLTAHRSLPTVNGSPLTAYSPLFLSGGTDLYVQRPEEMVEAAAENLFDEAELRFIAESGEFVEIGASCVVTDLLESALMQSIFPNLDRHLKLVSSTPIRNMATLAGNFVNASPIGDMTAWFLSLDAQIELCAASESNGAPASKRNLALRDFYLGYKQLDKTDAEYITKIFFRSDFTHFNFEKVCKRTYLDIASVNTGLSLKMAGERIEHAHVSAGGVAPVPLYLRKTSEFLCNKTIDAATINEACAILQKEIRPISDVRGSETYKRLLLKQLFTAHFVELFGLDI